MIRVLHVFGCLDRGGSETAIMNYYRHLDTSKVQFDFVTHFDDEGAYEGEIIAQGGRIYRLPRFTGANIISYWRAWAQLLIQHKEWKTIHIHIFTIAGVILPIAKLYGVKNRIVHCHNTSSPITTFAQKVANNVFRYSANIFLTHRFACSNIAGKYYFGDRDVCVLNNAIDSVKFACAHSVREIVRSKLSISNDKFIIGNVASFTKQKNHTFIVDIFSEIYKKDRNVTLLLIGVGTLSESIERKVTDLGLSDGVIFLGSRPDIPELMQAMDVFLFPSLWEGLGIVAIEAQASGLPTIISDEVPDAAMITDLAEKISLKESAEYWAKAVLKHNNGYTRRNMYDKVCKAGYDIHDNVKWLENFYLNEQ